MYSKEVNMLKFFLVAVFLSSGMLYAKNYEARIDVSVIDKNTKQTIENIDWHDVTFSQFSFDSKPLKKTISSVIVSDWDTSGGDYDRIVLYMKHPKYGKSKCILYIINLKKKRFNGCVFLK